MKNYLRHYLFLFVISSCTTWFVLKDLLRDPAHVVHELGGDAMKNYFAYLYHSLYGHGWQFSGINYPYGEHISFLDAQPAITITLSILRNWINWTPEQLNVILNVLMAFSFLLAIVYTYKVLCKFKVASTWAAIFAIFIVTLSAQNFNILGGYGLYYAFVTPLIFYWFILYKETGSLKYAVYVFMLASIVSFLHPYQLALILVWTVFYSIVHLIVTTASIKHKLKHIMPMLLSVVAATVIFKVVLFITDPVSDRPEYPHGLLSYCTTFDHLFKNNRSVYSQFLLKQGIIKTIPYELVGYYAYTGVATVVTLLTFCIYTTFQIITRKGKNLYRSLTDMFSPVWLLTALAALVFSMGIPFIWGFDFLFDYVASFRQFRALGWFGLLFYYVATIFSAVLLYSVYKKHSSKRKYVSTAVYLLLLLVWGFEAYGVVEKFKERSKSVYYNYDFFSSKYDKSWGELLSECHYEAKDFQAVLHVPYYHVGSEKIWLSGSAWGVCMAMKAAVELQLPLIEANMSRTSWEQTFKQVKMGGGPYTHKELLYTVDDNRPWLLMHLKDEKLNPNEQYIFDRASFLGEVSTMMTYILYPDSLRNYDDELQQRAKSIAGIKQYGDTNLCAGNMYYNHYNDRENDERIFGKAAALPVIDKDTTFEIIDVSNWNKEPMYEVSAWVLVNSINYHAPNIVVTLLDGKKAELARYNMPASASTDVQGLWFRPSLFLKLQNSTASIVLSTSEYGKGAYNGLDELLIRQVTDTIISVDKNGRVMANNHLLQ